MKTQLNSAASMSRRVLILIAGLSLLLSSEAMAKPEAQKCYAKENFQRQLHFSAETDVQGQPLQEGEPLLTNVSISDKGGSPLYCYVAKEQKAQQLALDCYDSRFWGARAVARIRFPIENGNPSLIGGDPVYSSLDEAGAETGPETFSCSYENNSGHLSFRMRLLGIAVSLGLLNGTCL